MITLRFDLVERVLSQVSSLHPSNDYKTVSAEMYARSNRAMGALSAVLTQFLPHSLATVVRAVWLESGDDTGDL
jgi:hypothetical protein